jgi:hypothetical protein
MKGLKSAILLLLLLTVVSISSAQFSINQGSMPGFGTAYTYYAVLTDISGRFPKSPRKT